MSEVKESTTVEDDVERAHNLLAQGKHNLKCAEVEQSVYKLRQSVDQLQQASELLSRKYGEMAPECAEVYFYSGCILLVVFKMESQAVGNVLQGEEEEGQEENWITDEEEEEGEEKEAQGDDAIIDDDDWITDEEEKEINEDVAAPSGEESMEEDELSSLQMALAYLVLARTIYEQNETKEGKLMQAEVLLKLGEIGLLTGSYDQALGHMKESLELGKSLLDSSDRRLAATYFMIGLAYQYSGGRYGEALEALRNAVHVFKLRLEKNRELIQSSDLKEESQVKAKKEIMEIEALIADVYSKMRDIEEEEKHHPGISQIGFEGRLMDTKLDR